MMLTKVSSLFDMHTEGPEFLYSFFQWYIPDFKYKYLGCGEAVRRYFRNRNLEYTAYSVDELKKMRKSESLFILGSNRSVNDIKPQTWAKIAGHDSLGFNNWVYHPFVPTYYSSEYDVRNENVQRRHEEQIKKRLTDYKNTIFLIHSRAYRRGMHPRLIPDLFPPRAKLAFYLVPRPFKCPVTRPLSPDDFKKTIFYGGSLNLHLHFARMMEYKKIVLVGCEMDTDVSFFDDLPEARWMFEISEYEVRKGGRYEGAYQRKNKHDFATVIRGINDYVFKREGIELYVFDKRSILYPEIPLFEFSADPAL